jgi:hypothetical protein
MSAALGFGLGPVVAERVSIEGPATLNPDRPLLEELAVLLGLDEVKVAVGLGGFDQWWKPVLQIFDTDGTPVGYAKVGWTPLTSSLVRNEGRILEVLAANPVQGLVIPDLLAQLQWAGHDVLVTAPLPSEVRSIERTMPPRCILPAVHGEGPLTSSRWWSALEDELGLTMSTGGPGVTSHGILGGEQTQRQLEELDDLRERALSAVSVVAERLGDAELPRGLFHGDWVPWNLAALVDANGDSPIVAWDWEYGSSDAPVGLDDVHGAFQVARQCGANVQGALSVAVVHGREVLNDRPTVELLSLIHPLFLLAKMQRALRLDGDVQPARLSEITAVHEVLERRLHRARGLAA